MPMADDELAKRVQKLEALVEALQAQNRRLKRAVAGDGDEFSTWDLDQMVPLHDRVEELEATVSDHADRFEMFVVEEGSQGTPDQRAMHLRQILLNQANRNDSSIAKLNRDQAASALGGDLHRSSVIDAMRRAANGNAADISGSSDLQPIGGIEFSTGAAVGNDGVPEQSHLLADTADVTGDEARKILTTVNGQTGVAD